MDKSIGTLTPDEQAMVDAIDLSKAPTPEESTALGPNFTARVIHRTLQEFRRRADIAKGPQPIADLSIERARRQTPPINS